jgi:hypothetical protein
MFAFLIFRFRFKKLMMLFAFLQMFDMCWFQFISDVIDMLEELKWPTLEERRQRAD